MAKPFNCKECGTQLKKNRLRSGELRFYCPECGWGKDRLDDPADHQSFGGNVKEQMPMTAGAVAVVWITFVAATLVCGVLIPIYFGELFELGAEIVGPRTWGLVSRYWIAGVVGYLTFCWVVHPEYIGIDGPSISWRYQAVTPTDYANEAVTWLIVFMTPGKLFCFAVYSTWKLFSPS